MKYFASKLSENMSKTPEGFLLCIGVPAGRIGDMEYGEDETPLEAKNGKVIISRDEDEVFAPETLASFEGKPFTIRHPEDFVKPENWKDLSKGHIQNVRRGSGEDKDNVLVDLLIMDHMAIGLVENGMRGLSFGYDAEYVQTGEGNGKQTKIRGNHLALVEEGRAGYEYRINDEKPKGDRTMKKEMIEKLKGPFAALAKAFDEATKDDAPPVPPKAEDEDKGYDELVKVCNEMMSKIEGMKKGKDEPEETENPEDEEVAPGLEDRLKAIEAGLAKLLEAKAEGADEEEESEDEDFEDEEGEESEDEEKDKDDHKVVGDEKSNAEILSPGIEMTKDVKKQALKKFYATADGKTLLTKLNGGKAPKFESQATVDSLFVSAAEVVKSKRTKEAAKSKTGDSSLFSFGASDMTIEKQNEMNEKHYNKKQA